MLIQLTSPRPMVNTAESPPYVRIHTLRKPQVSTGEVALVIGETRMEVEPWTSYPIEGGSGFEALEYYLPFWRSFGTDKPVYDEDRIRERIEKEQFSRVETDKPRVPRGKKFLVSDTTEAAPLPKRLNGVELAILGSTGYNVIAKSAHRTEGATYEQRIFNFTIYCAVNGAGMIRIANSPVDIANPTFDPYAPEPTGPRKNLVLLEAFNRTHKQRTSSIEERRRARIAEAEANIAKHERGPYDGPKPKSLPESSGEALGFRTIKRD